MGKSVAHWNGLWTWNMMFIGKQVSCLEDGSFWTWKQGIGLSHLQWKFLLFFGLSTHPPLTRLWYSTLKLSRMWHVKGCTVSLSKSIHFGAIQRIFTAAFCLIRDIPKLTWHSKKATFFFESKATWFLCKAELVCLSLTLPWCKQQTTIYLK